MTVIQKAAAILVASIAAFITFAMPANAGPLVPAIVGAAKVFGVTLTTAQAATWLATTAINLAMGVLQQIQMRNAMKDEKAGIATTSQTVGSGTPRSFILGRYATAGHQLLPDLIFDTDKDDRKYNSIWLALGDLPVTGIEEYYVDGIKVTLKPKVALENDDRFGQGVNEEYGNHARFIFYDGTQTEADPTFSTYLDNHPRFPITPDMRMLGVPYVIGTFKTGTKNGYQWNHRPSLRFTVKGIKAYDFRKDSSTGFGSGTQRLNDPATWEFSDNPVILVWNILYGIKLWEGQVWGVGAKPSAMPMSVWAAAANVCDEPGTQPSSTNPYDDIKRYRAGCEVKVDQQPLDVIEGLLASCGGQIAEIGGQYLITVGPPAAAVASITDETILAQTDLSFTVAQGLNASYNAVTAQYPDPRSSWETQDAEPLYNATWEAEDGGRRLPAALKLGYVPYPVQVRRDMRELANDNRRTRQHSIVLPPIFISVNPTETLSWTSETNGYVNKLFEVMSKTVDPATLAVTLTLKERDPSDYDFDAVSDGRLPTVVPITLPDNTIDGVNEFTAVAVTIRDAQGNPRRPAIRINWNSEVSYSAISYEIVVADTSAPVNNGSISDTATGSITIANGILANTKYSVRARAVIDGLGADQTFWTDWIEVTTGDIRLTWDDLADDVVQDYEDLVQGIADTDAAIANTNADIVAMREDVTDEINGVVLDLTNAMNSGIDTGITTYDTTVVQPGMSSLSAQITQLQASMTSADLVTVGNFATGDLTGWTLTGAAIAVEAKANSSIALMATCPKDYAANIGYGRGLRQALQGFTVTDADMLQLRFAIAGAAGQLVNRRAAVALEWIAADSSVISTDTQTYTAPNTTSWHVATLTFDPPDNAVNANLSISNDGNNVYWLISGIEAKTYDAGIEARVTAVEFASAKAANVLAGYMTSANARMNTISGDVSTLAGTTVDTTNALSLRIDSVQAQANNNLTTINTHTTAISNANNAIAQLDNRLTAQFGRTELMRDGEFADDLTHWTGVLGADSTRIIARNKAGTYWPYRDAPGGKIFRISNADAPISQSLNSNWFDVSPNEIYDYSFWYGAVGGGPIARCWVQWFDNSDTVVSGSPSIVDASQSIGIGAYKQYGFSNITPPAGAVKGRLIFQAQTAGSGADTVQGWVTGFSVRKRSAFEFTSGAEIVTLNQAVANANGAISALSSSTNAQYGAISASGMLRAYSVANTSVGISRVGLSVAAGNGANTQNASLFLEARSDGNNGVYIRADKLVFVNGPAWNATQTTPFFIEGGTTYIANALIKDASIDGAKIKDLTVDTMHLKSGAATRQYQASRAAAGTLSLTISNLPAAGEASISLTGFPGGTYNSPTAELKIAEGGYRIRVNGTVMETAGPGYQIGTSGDTNSYLKFATTLIVSLPAGNSTIQVEDVGRGLTNKNLTVFVGIK